MAASILAYRHLFRSTRLAFAGDAPLLKAARAEVRNNFRANIAAEGDELTAAVKHAEEVAQILKQNVVQGRQVDGEKEKYKLRIHEHTERGDNDTVKMPNGQKVTIDGKKCSDK